MNAPVVPRAEARSLSTWQEFQAELQVREQELAGLLPSNISAKRFLNSAIAAVKQTPELLKATPRTLFAALSKSAQDGLLPDGREGVISIYNTKVTVNSKDAWEKVAQWNPMAFGLRKRARELDGMIVDAQAIYKNDQFLWRQGDNPNIEHTPAQLGQNRGDLIGAYAIFRDKEGMILHREVMDKNAIEAVRSTSKSPNGLMWKDFTAEAYKKTVVRRGFKTVPASENLERVVTSDDDQFSFKTQPETPALSPPPPPATPARGLNPPPPPQVEARRDVEDAQVVTDTAAQGQAAGGQPDGGDAGGGQGQGEAIPAHPGVGNPETYLKWAAAVFATATSEEHLGDLFNKHIADDMKRLFPPDADELRKMYGQRIKALHGG